MSAPTWPWAFSGCERCTQAHNRHALHVGAWWCVYLDIWTMNGIAWNPFLAFEGVKWFYSVIPPFLVCVGCSTHGVL